MYSRQKDALNYRFRQMKQTGQDEGHHEGNLTIDYTWQRDECSVRLREDRRSFQTNCCVICSPSKGEQPKSHINKILAIAKAVREYWASVTSWNSFLILRA